MTLGVVLVIVGALVSAGVYMRLANAQEVLAIVAPVARGEQVSREDLGVARVGVDPLLAPIPASQIEAVVGMYALFDLVPGTFLTSDSVGLTISPGQGRAEVGVELRAGEYPDHNLRPGDAVLLVEVPLPTQVGSLATFPGFLVTVSASDPNMTIRVTVDVAASEAVEMAALSATDRLTLVLTSREGS
ncbi:MAG: SAF domain-containing protein [Propionibacteriaceae bacterium]|jgi:hypothetical protein|nr:SAF domain-containing protein [Propionibacteriaceae bacterium]